MKPKALSQYFLSFTILAALIVWTLLAWQYFHEGIPKHHLLANPDLPSVSNAWGALLIPLLSGYLCYRIYKAVVQNDSVDTEKLKRAVIGFAIAVFYSLTIALAFIYRINGVSDYLFMGLLLLALIFPLYRPQYYLGFVLGLTYFFGALLPTLVGSVIVLLSAGAHYLIHPVILKLTGSKRQ